MKLVPLASPKPWSVAELESGGWVIHDANGDWVCVFFQDVGYGDEHFDRHQVNAVMIVEAVNALSD